MDRQVPGPSLSPTLTEAHIEAMTLELLVGLDYAIHSGPDIAPACSGLVPTGSWSRKAMAKGESIACGLLRDSAALMHATSSIVKYDVIYN
jgi:hypothetical protein